MKRVNSALVAALALIALPAFAGEWHTGSSNLCTDCHTMHFSQAHQWGSETPLTAGPQDDGNWLGATGPNHFLLKAPANQLCLACHDGQTFAPDVLGANTNTSPANGRSAGALNEEGLGGGYDTFKGHTLGTTARPPGYDPSKVGITTDWYPAGSELECTSCHTQHGLAGVYRNLGPRTLNTGSKLPTYVISTTNDTTKDVWINIPAGYVANSGDAATFNPFYATQNVSYNRNDRTPAGATAMTSNAMDTQCGSCHGVFHGGPTDPGIADAGTVAGLDAFIRHPTGGIDIGDSGAAGYGGHSSLSRYVGATTKVKVYANDRTGYTDATPGCISCHKAHGNKNPFGLIFLARNATSVDEEGGFSGTEVNPAGAPAYQAGYRNLCGQCHSQGN